MHAWMRSSILKDSEPEARRWPGDARVGVGPADTRVRREWRKGRDCSCDTRARRGRGAFDESGRLTYRGEATSIVMWVKKMSVLRGGPGASRGLPGRRCCFGGASGRAAAAAAPSRRHLRLARASPDDEFDPFAEAPQQGSGSGSGSGSGDPSPQFTSDQIKEFANSPFVNSPIVAQETQELTSLFKNLSALQPKYASFDTAGKRIYIEQMQDLCEKLKVYTTRYKLSDDAYAQAMIDNLNKQLTLAGMNVDTLYQSFTEICAEMRQELEKEEKLGAEYVYEDKAKKAWGQVPPFLHKMMEDPEMARLMQDPEFIGIMQRCVSSPDPAAFAAEAQKNPKFMKLMQMLYERYGDEFGGPPPPPGAPA